MRSRGFFARAFAYWPAKIMALAAAVLLFIFNRMNNLSERALELPLEVITPEGFVLAEPLRGRATITVRADSEAALRSAEPGHFRAFVDLSGHRREGTFVVPVQYERRNGSRASEVFVDRVEPLEVTVSLERAAERTVAVVANISGAPEKGYVLSEYTVSPSIVRIRGPRQLVESTPHVLTEEINLAGITGDYRTRVGLLQPSPLVSFAGASRVEFAARISELIVTKEFKDVRVELEGAAPGYDWDVRPAIGRLVLQGPEAILESPEVEPPRLVAEVGQGRSTAAVHPRVPEGVTVLEFEPHEAEVTRRPKERS